MDLAILGFLSEKPRSGYDLKRRCFAGPVEAFWTADQAQIYRTLDRLQKDRLVSATRKRQAGRPDRKIYEITAAGSEALEAALECADALPPVRDPFLLQVYFGSGLDDTPLLQVLEARRDEYARRLDSIQSHSDELAAIDDIHPRDAVLKQTALDGALVQQKATLEWLDDCIRAVREGALPQRRSKGIGQRQSFGGSPA